MTSSNNCQVEAQRRSRSDRQQLRRQQLDATI